MVQVFDLTPTESNASMMGKSLGIGLGKNFQDPQQAVQRNLLSTALAKLPEGASYIDVLKTIGPELMTTPGGSQLLAEMGPILQKQAQSKAYLDYLNQNQAAVSGQNMPGGAGVPGTGALNATNQTEVKPTGEDYFKNPKPPVGKEGTYPKMSALPEPMPLMTPQEQQQRTQQLMANSLAQGQPADPVAIQNVVQNENNQRMLYNQNIEKERGIREEKQQNQSARMIKRFENSSAKPKSEEDKVVFEKFANEAKDAANENDAYTYARAKYNQFDNARNGLIRESEVPGFVEKMYNKATGTFKNKEDMMKQLQPNLKKLKDLGLDQEARSILSTEVGLGPEDTELAMYPPSKTESNFYNKLSSNPSYKKESLFEGGALFPGEESALPIEKFIDFKEKIANFLETNPEANLIAARGVLNQDKKYAWTDISKAVFELIDEGRFKPNDPQEKQLNVIKAPPASGFGQMFREFWKGTR